MAVFLCLVDSAEAQCLAGSTEFSWDGALTGSQTVWVNPAANAPLTQISTECGDTIAMKTTIIDDDGIYASAHSGTNESNGPGVISVLLDGDGVVGGGSTTYNPGDRATVVYVFDNPVNISNWRVVDIDETSGTPFQDVVSIDGWRGETPVGVTLDNYGSTTTTVSGNTITANVGSGAFEANNTTTHFESNFDSSVDSIRLSFIAGPAYANPLQQGIGISSFVLCCPLTTSDVDGLPDVIDLDDDNDGITDTQELCGTDPVLLGNSDIDITFNFDGYEDEITWSLTSPSNAIVLSGGPYTSTDELISLTYNATEVGVYTFRIYDSFGDGMSDGTGGNDSDGTAYYQLFLDGTNIFTSGFYPNFGDADTKTIEVYSENYFSCLPSDPALDDDNDGIINYRDADYCTLNANGVCTTLDNDGDGVPNHLDYDSDNDGILDNVEGQTYGAYIAPSGSDTDNDGLDDLYDSDCTLTAYPGSDASAVFSSISVNSANRAIGSDNRDATINRTTDELVIDLGAVLPAGTTVTVESRVNRDLHTYSIEESIDATFYTPLGAHTHTNTTELIRTYTLLNDARYVRIVMTIDAGRGSIEFDNVAHGPYSANPCGINGAAVAIPNTDGIDQANYLDSDNDNDNCPDAMEAGGFINYTNIDVNNMISGGVDSNGVPILAYGAQAINDEVMIAGPDLDGDNVAAACDIDEDNDGLIDEYEQGFSEYTLTSGNNSQNIAGSFNTTCSGAADMALIADQYDVSELAGSETINGHGFQWDQDGVGFGADPSFADLHLTITPNAQSLMDFVRVSSAVQGNTGSADNAEKDFSFTWTGGFTATLFDPYHQISSHTHQSAIPSGTILHSENYGQLANTAWYIEIDLTNSGSPLTIDYSITNAQGSVRFEGLGIDLHLLCDEDQDGIADYLDIDVDNDGIPDNIEAQTTAGYVAPSNIDADLDGLIDLYDSDDSNPLPSLSIGLDPVNTDGADQLDYKDSDSDNDGIIDIFENGDADNALSGTDTDSDGLDNNFDSDNVGWDPNDNINDPNPSTLTDSDGDVAADGNNAIPISNDVDYRDAPNIVGRVFEDINYGGGVGRPYGTSDVSAQASGWGVGDIGVENAIVELYDNSGNFVKNQLTDAQGWYQFDTLMLANYSVRIVNSSIASNRGSNSTGDTPLAVQTYRDDGTTSYTNEVGGADPSLSDAAANTTSQTLASLTTGSLIVQSVSQVTLNATSQDTLDFGYNFDVVVNTNNSGQGTLRQFIANSNELDNVDLDQEDSPSGGVAFPKDAGWEHSIFMIPGVGTHTIAPTSAYETITDEYTHISGYTQQGASQGTLAARTLAVEVTGSANTFDALRPRASNTQISGLVINDFRHGLQANFSGVDLFIWGNYIGSDVTGLVPMGNSGNGMQILNYDDSFLGSNADGVNDENEGNLVVDNDQGILIRNTGNVLIAGNIVGLNKNGNGSIGNSFNGIYIRDATAPNFIGFYDNAIAPIVSNLRNISSGNGNDGVRVLDSDNQVVAGNYLGTDVTGTLPFGNINYGIQLQGSTSNSIIGTDSDSNFDLLERNVISANGAGIRFLSTGTGINNRISGNYIGVDVTGNAPLGNNTIGVEINGDFASAIIGTNGDNTNDEVEGNVISDNGLDGLRLANTDSNIIAGNKIGVGADGTTSLPNTSRGILLTSGSNDNIIGYSTAMANTDELVVGNIIKNNLDVGVAVDGGLGNRISRNQIADNGSIGIDLDYDLVTPNDNGDPDNGSNSLLNFPVFSSVTAADTFLTISGFAPAGSVIEVFIADAGPNPSPLPAGFTTSFGEGAEYLFSSTEGSGLDLDGNVGTYTDDGTGSVVSKTQNRFRFIVNISGMGFGPGAFITATATDAVENTSEFSGVTEVLNPNCGTAIMNPHVMYFKRN